MDSTSILLMLLSVPVHQAVGWLPISVTLLEQIALPLSAPTKQNSTAPGCFILVASDENYHSIAGFCPRWRIGDSSQVRIYVIYLVEPWRQNMSKKAYLTTNAACSIRSTPCTEMCDILQWSSCHWSGFGWGCYQHLSWKKVINQNFRQFHSRPQTWKIPYQSNNDPQSWKLVTSHHGATTRLKWRSSSVLLWTYCRLPNKRVSWRGADLM